MYHMLLIGVITICFMSGRCLGGRDDNVVGEGKVGVDDGG